MIQNWDAKGEKISNCHVKRAGIRENQEENWAKSGVKYELINVDFYASGDFTIFADHFTTS